MSRKRHRIWAIFWNVVASGPFNNGLKVKQASFNNLMLRDYLFQNLEESMVTSDEDQKAFMRAVALISRTHQLPRQGNSRWWSCRHFAACIVHLFGEPPSLGLYHGHRKG